MAPFFRFRASLNQVLDTGQQLLDSGKPEEAARLFQEGIEQAPGEPYLLLYSGLALVESGESEAGLEQIRQALELAPEKGLLALFYARALYDTGDLAAAERECQRVDSTQPPGEPHSGNRVLKLLCRAGDNPLEALTGLTMLGLSDDPEMQGRALLLAEQVLSTVDLPDARDGWPGGRNPWDAHPGLIAALAAMPSGGAPSESYKDWLKRCTQMQRRGYREHAIVFAEAAMREHPDDDTRSLLAQLYFDTGRYAEAEAALRDSFLDDSERHVLLGVCLFHLGDFPGAIDALARATSIPSYALHVKGRAFLALEKRAEARRAFVQAARQDESVLDESVAGTRVALAYLHLRARVLIETPVPDAVLDAVPDSGSGTVPGSEGGPAAVHPPESEVPFQGSFPGDGVQPADGPASGNLAAPGDSGPENQEPVPGPAAD